jgi:hypothetical protein
MLVGLDAPVAGRSAEQRALTLIDYYEMPTTMKRFQDEVLAQVR